MESTKQAFRWLVYIWVMLAVIISTAFNLISEELDVTPVEPIIIEKEVIVYVEKEPEPEIIPEVTIVEPVEPEVTITEQPLDYNFDIMIPSGYTVDDLYRSLGGIRNGMEDTLQAIVDAEAIYGINALYLLATLGYESGWGKHESGINNIAGWKGGPNGTWSDYPSRYDCVMDVAEGLSTSFVNDVGSNINSVTTRYCPDPGYLNMLLQIMSDLKNNI